MKWTAQKQDINKRLAAIREQLPRAELEELASYIRGDIADAIQEKIDELEERDELTARQEERLSQLEDGLLSFELLADNIEDLSAFVEFDDVEEELNDIGE